MKPLFYILVALNVVVFAVMIGSKVFKQHFPGLQAPQPAQQSAAPPQVIINMADYKSGDGSNTTASASINNVPAGVQIKRQNNNVQSNQSNAKPQAAPAPRAQNNRNQGGSVRSVTAHGDVAERLSTPRVQYKACSARVSIPEDDYHRIKGLLRKYPHAASRQVVQGGGEGDSQSSARMNVLFMSVNDQQAGAIQGVVGRYGQLNRTPCDR